MSTKRSIPGWIYLVKAEGFRQYKIGQSSGPIIRLLAIQKQSPARRIELIHVFYSTDAAAAEHALHQRFAAHRTHGEWLDLPQDAVDYICSLEEITS